MSARAGRIRVLVVEDSRFMRGVIARILASDPEIEVIGAAQDGLEAVTAVACLAPDVVTMDVQMPRADGLAAVERIMSERPTPIVMISAYTRPDSTAAFRALELGAVDFVAKPSCSVDLGLETLREEIVRKVRTAARVRPVRTARAAGPGRSPRFPAPPAADADGTDEWAPCVVVAASTGGPAALLSLVPALPADLPASVLIVQHMPAGYTAAFARELAARAALPVKEAEDGERLARGTAYVVPGSRHLSLAPGGRVTLRAGRSGSEVPSADVTMVSVARHAGPGALGVVLTGMGRDGAAGARAIRDAGGLVIAQDEATSVVFGMPRAAIELGAVDAVVSLGEMPTTLAAFVEEAAGLAARGRGHA